MTIGAIIYARASAECSTSAEEQIDTLKAVAAIHGWTVARTFADRAMPLKRGREQRPSQVALLAAIRAGAVSKVLLFSLDRIGRSLTEVVAFLENCRATGVNLYIHDRQIDTAVANGLTLFEFNAMLAQYLRQRRRERIMRGQASARNASIKFGRPPIASAKIAKAKLMLAAGKGVRETARAIGGISPASVSRLKAAMSTISL
jgi:DNA invertase Pin-like site-specific DNA recombinase